MWVGTNRCAYLRCHLCQGAQFQDRDSGLTFTSNVLTTLNLKAMTSPVLVPAAPAGGPCFMLCHCLSPEFRYDCTRLRVLISWTPAMHIMIAALILGITSFGSSSGSWNKGVTCMHSYSKSHLQPCLQVDHTQNHTVYTPATNHDLGQK